MTSILESTKKILGIDPTYTAFDYDILTHINSAFTTLGQLGIGPLYGFEVEDGEATWEDFLGDDKRFNSIKTYIYLRVRLLFDPPTTGYAVTAINEQLRELEWRLSAQRETMVWAVTHPTLPLDSSDTVLDGGTP